MDVTTGDYNEDGNLDFIIGGDNSVLTLFLGHGDGTFTTSTLQRLPTSGRGNDYSYDDEDGH